MGVPIQVNDSLFNSFCCYAFNPIGQAKSRWITFEKLGPRVRKEFFPSYEHCTDTHKVILYYDVECKKKNATWEACLSYKIWYRPLLRGTKFPLKTELVHPALLCFPFSNFCSILLILPDLQVGPPPSFTLFLSAWDYWIDSKPEG